MLNATINMVKLAKYCVLLQSKWLINYLEIEKVAREYVAKVREGGWEAVRQQLFAWADKYIQFNRNT